ncbi:hypothetical protein Trco_000184 [Trichoderma cornu-damae]|uniref:Uncharacterized protein n=1 Tax=Trichoderma cornu-damae TaxID=654480 RepID=A0A9P8U037_9HYPO|nr:hypothetical protein Trco_000184 [Trichoderma cornu-damae]
MAPKITSQHEGARVPLPGQVISVMLSLAATTFLTLFLTQRILVIKAWGRLPPVVWLVFAIYADSYVFVIATAVLQHSLGVNSSFGICEAAIILCLYIIRGATKPRLKSTLYLVNSLGMLTIYIAVIILNFHFRITKMRNGECIIGMRSVAMIPLISFDTVINVYLTIMFLIPLKKLYSYTNMAQTPANIRLRMVAFRTFCGAVCTLVSSIVNLSVLMALNGEPGWVCLMCCNCDILFSAIVIQWVTSRDNAGTVSSISSGEGARSRDRGLGINHISTPSDLHETPPSTLTDISLEPTRRRSSGADDGDLHDRETPGADAAKVSNDPSNAVVVATTIERKTRPRSHDDTGLPTEASEACACGCLISLTPNAGDGQSLSPQAKITAGGSHFLEGFDQKLEPRQCQSALRPREVPRVT